MKATSTTVALRWSRAAPIRRLARSLDGHAVLAAAFVLVIACAAFFIVPPTTPTFDASRSTIVSVAPGTMAWNARVRPGTPVTVTDDERGTTIQAEIDGAYVVIPLRPRVEAWAIGAAVALTALTLAISSLSAAAAAQLAAVALFVTGLLLTAHLGGLLTAPVLLSAPTVAAAYAVSPQRRMPGYRHLAVAMVALAITVHAAGVVGRHDNWGEIQAATGVITAALLAAGWVGALAPGCAAAARETAHANGLRRIRLFARALLDELLPGRDQARLAATEAERARLAADLHAKVLPEIGRAASPDELADRISARVRQIMNERHSPVLAALGLLPALEDLAETTDAGDVEILIETEVDADAVRPPRAVEAAAYRVAELAIDNALRHADATTISVELAAANPGEVHLRVVDDGRGIDPELALRATRDGHRGLADMRLHADSIGASLEIGRRSDGGTEVELRWKH